MASAEEARSQVAVHTHWTVMTRVPAYILLYLIECCILRTHPGYSVLTHRGIASAPSPCCGPGRQTAARKVWGVCSLKIRNDTVEQLFVNCQELPGAVKQCPGAP
jgi:hypothetical protein